MDANQRSEINNQTNNGANEKGTPGAQGKTADNGQPLDHTYPQGGASQQRDGESQADSAIRQSGAGAGTAPGNAQRSDALNQSAVPGGSMETQINGGSGTVQGITDSHQRQMEQKSGAYGMLEQPVGDRPKDSGVNLNQQRGNVQGGNTGSGGMAGPQGSAAGSAHSGSMGSRQSGNVQSGNVQGGKLQGGSTRGGGMRGPQGHDGQEAQAGNTQLGVSGSHAAANQNADYGGVHESNDAAGGLPRSPGNSGPVHAGSSTDRAGSQTGTGADDGGPTHESNDAAGGYPRSPGYANRLAGDRNMDDDTGFKRKP